MIGSGIRSRLGDLVLLTPYPLVFRKRVFIVAVLLNLGSTTLFIIEKGGAT
jgi:hypothetical protein